VPFIREKSVETGGGLEKGTIYYSALWTSRLLRVQQIDEENHKSSA
jgi:hypothetical protein